MAEQIQKEDDINYISKIYNSAKLQTYSLRDDAAHTAINTKQDALTADNAGDNITIETVDNIVKISAVDTTEDARFQITDPQENQLLIYTGEAWNNKNLNSNSIELNNEKLNVIGFTNADKNTVPVKVTETTEAGDVETIIWQPYISSSTLQSLVEQAEQHKNQAGAYATQAGNEAATATIAAGNAERSFEKTMQFVNDKFWWGTAEEYNALLSSLRTAGIIAAE